MKTDSLGIEVKVDDKVLYIDRSDRNSAFKLLSVSDVSFIDEYIEVTDGKWHWKVTSKEIVLFNTQIEQNKITNPELHL